MNMEDRWKLATLAHKYGILVVADEVYHLLDWRDVDDDTTTGTHCPRRPARMAVIDGLLRARMQQEPRQQNAVDTPSSQTFPHSRPGGCISVSSFTKVFAPGVRCGWIECARSSNDVMESLLNLGYIQSQGGCAPFVGDLILCTSLSKGYSDKVLVKLNAAYRERSQRLVQALSSEPGIQLDTVPLGGYFIWVTFRGVDDATDFLKRCTKHGVRFLPGSRCNVGNSSSDKEAKKEDQNDDCRRCARLCFADLDTERLETGAARLIAAYRDYLQRKSQQTQS